MHGAERGQLISIEGIDCAGKSTLARSLAESLERQGVPVRQTREPGGSPGAEDIRKLLVEGDPKRWSDETDTLLHVAARNDHYERMINPSLRVGDVVVCDRYIDCTRAYQGHSSPDLRRLIDDLHRQLKLPEADLMILLDVDPELASERGLVRSSTEDRYERNGLAFQARVREAYLDIARAEPSRCVIVDASKSEDEVFSKVWEHLGEYGILQETV